MTKSALQVARASLSHSTTGLNGNVNWEGAAKNRCATRKRSNNFFPHYGMPIVKFTQTRQAWNGKPLNVGVILSGGQAPGGTM